MKNKTAFLIAIVVSIAIFGWLMKSKAAPLFVYSQLRHGVTVEVLEEGTRLAFLRAEPRYILHISRRQSPYGHDVDISLFNFDEELITYLHRGRVTEDGQGITFTQASGHSIFIPRKWYEGGR